MAARQTSCRREDRYRNDDVHGQIDLPGFAAAAAHADDSARTDPRAPAQERFEFAVAAPRGSGGTTLTIDVRYEGTSLGVRKLPVGVDKTP